MMDREEGFDSFELKNNAVLDQQIQAIALINLPW